MAGANCDSEATVQLSRAGVRCCRNVTSNGVSSPAVSGGIFCAIQSQVWLLMSSPNALSWYVLFCVFPAVPLQALGPEPSSRTLSPTRDTLAMEPAQGLSQHPADGKGGVRCVLPRRGPWGLRCACPPVVPHCGSAAGVRMGTSSCLVQCTAGPTSSSLPPAQGCFDFGNVFCKKVWEEEAPDCLLLLSLCQPCSESKQLLVHPIERMDLAPAQTPEPPFSLKHLTWFRFLKKQILLA